MKKAILILPLLILAVAFCVTAHHQSIGLRLTLGAILVVAILWAILNVTPVSIAAWVFGRFHRSGSRKSALQFAVAYGGGLVCMILAFSVLKNITERESDVFFTFLWPILAMPAIFASASVWVALRRNQLLPTAISMTAIFTAIAAVFFALEMRNGGWKKEVVIQSLIGFHGALILTLVPMIRWWFHRKLRTDASTEN